MNSVLIDDIEQLKNGVEDLISYQDISYNGLNEDDSVTISNEKCLLQKMKIWLQSDINDYHRNPEMGGVIIDNARKMRLTSENAKVLENLIYHHNFLLALQSFHLLLFLGQNIFQRKFCHYLVHHKKN